ncbi:MAG TPA: hypothetical protein VL986_12160 [Terracidiphilus sp.]|nr:hypothetical protein [Terracidiphilus sp.]
MEYPPSVGILDILRSTLFRLQQTEEFKQDDPAVNELKRHIVRSISELEVLKSSSSRTEPEFDRDDSITVLRMR